MTKLTGTVLTNSKRVRKCPKNVFLDTQNLFSLFWQFFFGIKTPTKRSSQPKCFWRSTENEVRNCLTTNWNHSRKFAIKFLIMFQIVNPTPVKLCSKAPSPFFLYQFHTDILRIHALGSIWTGARQPIRFAGLMDILIHAFHQMDVTSTISVLGKIPPFHAYRQFFHVLRARMDV